MHTVKLLHKTNQKELIFKPTIFVPNNKPSCKSAECRNYNTLYIPSVTTQNKKLSYNRDIMRCRCRSPQPKSII